MNNKKIGHKHVAIRYAKHVDAIDDGKSSRHLKIPALAAGSFTKGTVADKKSKIQQIEEQLKHLQKKNSEDFEINETKNLNKNAQPSEPLIKKYQFNKETQSTSTGRNQNFYKKRHKHY